MRRLLAFPLLTISFATLIAPAASSAGVFISVGIAPPALPVYVQPVCPADGYIWTPGYWAYGPAGYFWVPGTWILPPRVGVLWTPGYWGWGGSAYLFHAGYWGPHVGFYGGVNYGFGYTGVGFAGGFWKGGAFSYNRAVTNINVTNVHNVYNRTVVNNVTVNRVSYNGGAGGIQTQASAQERAAEHEQHVAPTSQQQQHERSAASNREQLASVNHGRPAVAASPRPGEFHAQNAGPGKRSAAAARPNNPARPAQERAANAQRPSPAGTLTGTPGGAPERATPPSATRTAPAP